MNDNQQIHFVCPECGSPICAPLSRGGKRGKCPSCRSKVSIPETTTFLQTIPQPSAVVNVVSEPRREQSEPTTAPPDQPVVNPLLLIRDFKGETDRHRNVIKLLHEQLAELDAYMRESEPDVFEAGTDALIAKAVGENRRVAIDRMLEQVELARTNFGNDHHVYQAARKVVLDACRRGKLPIPNQLEKESEKSHENETTVRSSRVHEAEEGVAINPNINSAIENLSKQLAANKRLVEYLDSCGEFTFEKHQEAYRIAGNRASPAEVEQMWNLARAVLPPFLGEKNEDGRPPHAWGAEYSRWVLQSAAQKAIGVLETTIPKIRRARTIDEAITILEYVSSDVSLGSPRSSDVPAFPLLQKSTRELDQDRTAGALLVAVYQDRESGNITLHGDGFVPSLGVAEYIIDGGHLTFPELPVSQIVRDVLDPSIGVTGHRLDGILLFNHMRDRGMDLRRMFARIVEVPVACQDRGASRELVPAPVRPPLQKSHVLGVAAAVALVCLGLLYLAFRPRPPEPVSDAAYIGGPPFTVVDLPHDAKLPTRLREEARVAQASGRVPLLCLWSPDQDVANSAAFDDPSSWSKYAGTHIVRLDVRVGPQSLASIGIQSPVIPGFRGLGDDGRALAGHLGFGYTNPDSFRQFVTRVTVAQANSKQAAELADARRRFPENTAIVHLDGHLAFKPRFQRPPAPGTRLAVLYSHPFAQPLIEREAIEFFARVAEGPFRDLPARSEHRIWFQEARFTMVTVLKDGAPGIRDNIRDGELVEFTVRELEQAAAARGGAPPGAPEAETGMTPGGGKVPPWSMTVAVAEYEAGGDGRLLRFLTPVCEVRLKPNEP